MHYFCTFETTATTLWDVKWCRSSEPARSQTTQGSDRTHTKMCRFLIYQRSIPIGTWENQIITPKWHYEFISPAEKNYNFEKLNWVIHSIFYFSFSQWKTQVRSVTWTGGLQSDWQMQKSNHSSSAQTITPSVTTSANGLTLHGLMRGLQINKSSDDFWSFSLFLSVSLCVCVGVTSWPSIVWQTAKDSKKGALVNMWMQR